MHTRIPAPVLKWFWPAAALALFGCPSEELAPLEPCTVAGVAKKVTQSGTDQVDLLFMIDNSGSMSEEQENLAAELPDLVRILATGDLGLDGTIDFQPVKSLHLGVVSSDMGIGGIARVGTCGLGNGDDGLLLDRVSDDCAGTTVPIYQTFDPALDDPETVANNFACVAQLGTEGCGLEQQLEAIWKAVAPESDDSFLGGTAGHQEENATDDGPFLRDEAVLAVIAVSDEEDCSVKQAGLGLFDPNSTDARFQTDDGVEDINIRCQIHAEDTDLVQPTSRYVNGLLSLKPDFPDRVIFAGIVGVPEDLDDYETAAGVQDFDAILALDAMQFRPAGPVEAELAAPVPACETARGKAYPARRFVEVAKGFGANGLVRSICAESFEDALDAILNKISKQLVGACLPQPLNPNSKGVVECDVVEILKKGDTECDAARGRKFKENRLIAEGDMRTVCTINQVAVDDDNKLVPAPNPIAGLDPLVGWYYDDFSADIGKCPPGQKRQIAFTKSTTVDASLEDGAEANIECFSPVGGNLSTDKGKAAVGAPCDPNADKCSDANLDKYTLQCERTSKSCQILCDGDDDCPDAWACDVENAEPDDGPYCVNTTCQAESSQTM